MRRSSKHDELFTQPSQPPNPSISPGFCADAKFIGAVLGVSLGCILGMAPLAFMDPGFFTPPADANTAETDD